MRNYVVLVSLDGGRTWARYDGPDGVVEAGGQKGAAEVVRKASPELRQSEDAMFYAQPADRFKPMAKRKQMVERWAWGDPKPPEAQAQLATDPPADG
jgi:hypothetical protein